VVRRVAVGAAEVVPFVQVTNLARTLQELQERNIWLIGTELDATAKSLYDTDLKGSIAIVMGAEGTGLRRLTRETCDQLAYIPMRGDVQSLNVSVAAGICLFETLRQRL
jgi:23S rRNA (guanosine2251-2'-O)-methyltransferase